MDDSKREEVGALLQEANNRAAEWRLVYGEENYPENLRLALDLAQFALEAALTPPAEPTDDERKELAQIVQTAYDRSYDLKQTRMPTTREFFIADDLLAAGFRRSTPATREEIAEKDIGDVIALALREQDIYVDGDLEDMVIDTSGTRANLLTVAKSLMSRFTITAKGTP